MKLYSDLLGDKILLKKQEDDIRDIIEKIEDEQIKPLKDKVKDLRYKSQSIDERYLKYIKYYKEENGFEPTHIFDSKDDYYGFKKMCDMDLIGDAYPANNGIVLARFE